MSWNAFEKHFEFCNFRFHSLATYPPALSFGNYSIVHCMLYSQREYIRFVDVSLLAFVTLILRNIQCDSCDELNKTVNNRKILCAEFIESAARHTLHCCGIEMVRAVYRTQCFAMYVLFNDVLNNSNCVAPGSHYRDSLEWVQKYTKRHTIMWK